jgi:cell division septation protein DedD
MVLEDLDALTAYDNAQIDAQSPDPLDEEQPVAAPPPKVRPQPSPHARPASTPVVPADDNAPFGMPASPAAAPVTPEPDVDEADQELFGTVWPLGETVRLDSTVDRQRLRQQCQRLSELGYAMDFKSQAWNRAA